MRFHQSDNAFWPVNRDRKSWETRPGTDISNLQRAGREFRSDEQRFAVVQPDRLLKRIDSSQIQPGVPLAQQIVVSLEQI
jgi:hypothetical protein